MSVEPTPPCGDDEPEAHAGELVDDGWEVDDDGGLDPGAVSEQPEG